MYPHISALRIRLLYLPIPMHRSNLFSCTLICFHFPVWIISRTIYFAAKRKCFFLLFLRAHYSWMFVYEIGKTLSRWESEFDGKVDCDFSIETKLLRCYIAWTSAPATPTGDMSFRLRWMSNAHPAIRSSTRHAVRCSILMIFMYQWKLRSLKCNFFSLPLSFSHSSNNLLHSSMHSTGFYFTFETNIICLIGLYVHNINFLLAKRQNTVQILDVQSEMVLMVFELNPINIILNGNFRNCT